jgi:hypothetical protein
MLGHRVARPAYYAASDISRASRVVLKQDPGYPMHVFGDMFKRLPQSVIDACDLAAPYSEMKQSDPVMAEQQFLKLKDIQDAYYDGPRFNQNVRCKCDAHDGALCQVYPPRDPDSLTLNVAGLECVDYTPLGNQLRLAGDSSRKQYLWVAERKKLQEDLIVAECWRDFPWWTIAEDL